MNMQKLYTQIWYIQKVCIPLQRSSGENQSCGTKTNHHNGKDNNNRNK